MYEVLLITQRNGTGPPLHVLAGDEMCGYTWTHREHVYIRIIYREKTRRCSVTSSRPLLHMDLIRSVGNDRCTFKCLDDGRK